MASPLKAFAAGGPARRAAVKWYSALEKAIESADPHLSLPLDKWVQYLTGRPGVKQEEIDYVLPQVKEMLGPRTGPILKADIKDLVAHVNSITPLQEWQSGRRIEAKDLPYTSEPSPLQMYSQIHRSTPEAALQFEVGQGHGGDRFGTRFNYHVPEVFDANEQYTVNPGSFTNYIVDQFNYRNATKYDESSRVRLTGGKDYKETVIGSPLAEPMQISGGHFGEVPKVGKNQVSWALHHSRDDGPLPPELMAIPDEIEQVIETKTRKGQVGSLNDVRPLARPAPVTPEPRGPVEIDEADPFGTLDELTAEFAEWADARGAGQVGDAEELLNIAHANNWPQEHIAYLTDFRERWQTAQEIADGIIPAVRGWEHNPDYNPQGPVTPDNAPIVDPDEHGRLSTAYDNYNEIVEAGGQPNHMYFTYQGIGITNPYADDAGQVLMNPGAYWAARGIDRRQVHRAMNDFLVRYQHPIDTAEDAMPPMRNNNAGADDMWGNPADRFETLEIDGDDELNQYAPYFTVGEMPVFNPMKTEDGAALPNREAALQYWTHNQHQVIDEDTVNAALDHWERGAHAYGVNINVGEIEPRGVLQTLQDRYTAARREWLANGGAAEDTNLAFGNYENADGFLRHLDELEPDQVQEMLDNELPADLADLIDEYRGLRDGRLEAPPAEVNAPEAPPAGPAGDYAREQARMEARAAEHHLEQEFNRARQEGENTFDTFEEFLADIHAIDHETVFADDGLNQAIRRFIDAEDRLMDTPAPAPAPAPADAPAGPPRRLDQARENMLNIATREYGNVPDIRQSVLDIMNGPDILTDEAIAATGWPRTLQDAAREFSMERRLQNIDFNDPNQPVPHPEQMDQRTDFERLSRVLEDEGFDMPAAQWLAYHRGNRAVAGPYHAPIELEHDLEQIQNVEARDIARRLVNQEADPIPPEPQGPWEVFNPNNGETIRTYATEAEARAYAERRQRETNGAVALDYARAGEGWTTEQKTQKVPNPDKPKGSKVTFIDELQSHRHQEGRQEGYKGEDVPIRAEKDRLFRESLATSATWEPDYLPLAKDIPTERWTHLYGDSQTDQGISQQRNAFIKSVRSLIEDQQDPQQAFTDLFGVDPPEGALESLATKLSKHEEAKKQYELIDKQLRGKSFNTPHAPYKKSWPLLTFRRMLWQAAEDGSDYLAWNTAEAIKSHGTGDAIAKALYDKELPNIAKGELKRLGLSKDDLTQIDVGPNKNKGAGLSDRHKQLLTDLGDPDLGPEEMEIAEAFVSDAAFKRKISNVLTPAQISEVYILEEKFNRIRRVYKAHEDDDEAFENFIDISHKMVNLLRNLKVHEKLLNTKKNAWAIKLTPEVREKILKEGLPKFAAVGLPAAEVQEFFASEENDARPD